MISMVECTGFKSLDRVTKPEKEFGFQSNYPLCGHVAESEKEWAPGEWMRPLGGVENMFAIGAYLKSLNTVQATWISSKEPITKDIMINALEHLTKRIPILQVCIQRRGTSLWFRRTEKQSVNFDILHDDAMKVIHELRNSTYNLSKGPLWLVRMVPVPADEPSPRGICAKNQVVVVFSVLHAITDATTNLVLCKELVKILNDLFKSRTVPFEPYHFGYPHADKMANSTRSYLIKYFCKRFFDVLILDFNKKTTFKGLVPLPKNYEVETRVLSHVFDEDLSARLIKRCKENSTTVHACLVTATNASYLDLARCKSKDNVDEITLYYADCINLRRYFPESEKVQLGCHVTLHEGKSIMTSEKRDNFWSSARSYRAGLHEVLSEKTCLKIIPIIKWASIVFPLNIYRNKKKTCNITDRHYITTNMGDITKIVGESEPEDTVHLNDLFRSANGEQAGMLFTLTCHTFRKRLYLSIDYYCNKITHKNAEDLFEDLKQKLTSLADNGTY